MSTSAHPGAGEPDFTPGAGASTDQQVTGTSETGTFTTDEAPTADTPADGSTNAGINQTRANRPDPEPQS
ncbi:hypothetical protein [Actinoplanes sp. TFC3]|uniref:hypothetical protein n=1 Tax=Actinoplanes sp. TFC3 TaxID=1710355 RepID=UPI00082BB004|nr:hypothetical protein [Actinoplanes sp. TFC3]